MTHRTIVRMQFGSHLYGTATPASDVDLKSVFIPDARSLLLQSAPRTISNQRPKGHGEKNYAGEIDEEKISLQQFMKLAAEGQTMALDMLFAPMEKLETASYEWHEIWANRDKLLTKKSAAFIGYARTQANKYGIKGSRVAAARFAFNVLVDFEQAYGGMAKLGSISDLINQWVTEHEHMSLETDTTPHGQEIILWNVCDRKMPFTASIKNAREIMGRIVQEYGRRALMAETQEGVDWKALSHAVRVGDQAVELLNTGHITFPLVNAAHIVDIKLGKLLYQDVAAEIEDLLERVEAAAITSKLPNKPDQQWIDDYIAYNHKRAIIS